MPEAPNRSMRKPRLGLGAKVSAAGWWILAGTALFIASRVVIEIVRIRDAAEQDQAFAASLAWTAILVVTISFPAFLGLNYLMHRSAIVRHHAVLESDSPAWLFEAIRTKAVQASFASAGAPMELIGRRENTFLSVSADEAGISFWTGAKTPERVWSLAWQYVSTVDETQTEWQWLTLRSVRLVLDRSGASEVAVVVPLYELGFLQPRPLSEDAFAQALATLREFARAGGAKADQ